MGFVSPREDAFHPGFRQAGSPESRVVDDVGPGNDPRNDRHPARDTEKTRPTIITNTQFGPQSRQSTAKDAGANAYSRPSPRQLGGSGHQRQASGTKTGLQSRQQASFGRQRKDEPTAISPQLRQHAISASQASPMETLPALQASPMSASRSPSAPQSLPSLHSQFGLLPPPPPSNASASLPARAAYPTNPSVPSPSQEFATTRNGPYPPSSRATGPYPMYPPAEASPSSTTSGISPRDTFSATPSARNTSPTAHFNPSSQYKSTSTAQPPPLMSQQQGEVQTPISAGTQIQTPLSARTQSSITTMSTEPSPMAERLNSNGSIDTERPILPPLSSNGASAGGSFRCEHPGCNAQPFQTQYLLK